MCCTFLDEQAFERFRLISLSCNVQEGVAPIISFVEEFCKTLGSVEHLQKSWGVVNQRSIQRLVEQVLNTCKHCAVQEGLEACALVHHIHSSLSVRCLSISPSLSHSFCLSISLSFFSINGPPLNSHDFYQNPQIIMTHHSFHYKAQLPPTLLVYLDSRQQLQKPHHKYELFNYRIEEYKTSITLTSLNTLK